MTKRKDTNGRILYNRECQRKDGRYVYRYMDSTGKRRSLYATELSDLRGKERVLQRDEADNINYAEGCITVNQLLERYVALKQGVRYATKVNYRFVMNLVKKESFGQRRINSIRISDAKLWFMKLQQDGRGYSTIACIRGVIRPAFQMACDEDVIRKNPFAFSLAGVVVNDSQKRRALTEKEQQIFMNFVKNDPHYSRCYDEFNVLLGTGMRVSELCGLTKNDLDFENKRIRVERQLIKEKGGVYHAPITKTESGVRYIPMSLSVQQSLEAILRTRAKPKKEIMADGYTGFLLLDKNNNPKVASNIEHDMQWTMKKYRSTCQEPLPQITPHILRHTFCTNMANSGMDVKSLQYIMGHSDAGVTMNVYTHVDFEHAAQSMQKAIVLSEIQKNGTL